MNQRQVLVTFAVIVALASGLMAQDDRGVANDPSVNERANACFAGGSLAGQCHTTDADRDGVVDELDIAFMWWCGWYVIRVEGGYVSPSAVPPSCYVQPPPVPAIEAPPAPAPTMTGPRLLRISFSAQNPFNTPQDHLKTLMDVFKVGRVEVSGAVLLLFLSALGGDPVAQMSPQEWDAFTIWYANQ